tara:strand:+ start:307 stop:1461 length:1155 start_codon:yes stop_codon:yes gene_type:complete
MENFDLILKDGHIIDPSQEFNSQADVGLHNGTIKKIQKNLDTSMAKQVIDVSNCIVTPGLIDLHTHVYWGGTSLGVNAENFCRKSAVTTAVDTGSTGPGNFAGFKTHVIEKSEVNILAFLHISHAGIFAFSPRVMVGESEDISLMDPKTAIEVIEKNRDYIIGVKVRLGKNTSGKNGIAPLKFAKNVAKETKLPLMVHIDDAPPSYSEVLNQMRPLDILTHCFRPLPNAPINSNKKILPAVLAARERGVLFDVGHGMGSFSFAVTKSMLSEKFFPDTISSDIHAMCIDGPAHDLVTTMSKFLNLGMPIYDIIKSCTLNASLAINRTELGNLRLGSVGNISILKIQQGNFNFFDVTGHRLIGKEKIIVKGVVLNGKLWHHNQEII